jgi:hypothetical protein
MRRDMWIPRIRVRLQLPITGALLAELLVLGVCLWLLGEEKRTPARRSAAVDLEGVQVEHKDMPI